MGLKRTESVFQSIFIPALGSLFESQTSSSRTSEKLKKYSELNMNISAVKQFNTSNDGDKGYDPQTESSPALISQNCIIPGQPSWSKPEYYYYFSSIERIN